VAHTAEDEESFIRKKRLRLFETESGLLVQIDQNEKQKRKNISI